MKDQELFEGDLDYEWDEQDIRVGKILGKPGMAVTDKSLKKYYLHLKRNLTSPCDLFGMDDHINQKFSLIEILNPDECDDDSHGLFAKVRRVPFKRQGIVPLCDLEAVDKKSKNHQLLDDYSCWYVNNR